MASPYLVEVTLEMVVYAGDTDEVVVLARELTTAALEGIGRSNPGDAVFMDPVIFFEPLEGTQRRQVEYTIT